MNRFLHAFNGVGICVLAILCGFQWQENRRANLRGIELEKVRLFQVGLLSEKDQAIRGLTADLEELRQRLLIEQQVEKETERKLAATTSERNTIKSERDGLARQCEQLKENLDQWQLAVAGRDAALKKAGDDLQKIATERNEAILKFNELALKYNAIVKSSNGSASKG